jgi:hydrogenase maturation factor
MADTGLRIIEECPDIATSIFKDVADLDIVGTYPNEEILMNISKETTKRELCSIRGIAESVRRTQGINLTGGHTNAVEVCVEFFGAASFAKTLEEFEKTLVS